MTVSAADVRRALIEVYGLNAGVHLPTCRVNQQVRARFSEEVHLSKISTARTGLINTGFLVRVNNSTVYGTLRCSATAKSPDNGISDIVVSSNCSVLPTMDQARLLVMKAMLTDPRAAQDAADNTAAVIKSFKNISWDFRVRLQQLLSRARASCASKGWIKRLFSDLTLYSITASGKEFLAPIEQDVVSPSYEIDPNESNTTKIGLGAESFIFNLLRLNGLIAEQTIAYDDRMYQHTGKNPLFTRQADFGTHVSGSKQIVDGMLSRTIDLPTPTILHVKAAKNPSDLCWVHHLIMDSMFAGSDSNLPAVIIAAGPGYTQDVLDKVNARYMGTEMFPYFQGVYTPKAFIDLISSGGWKQLSSTTQ